MTATDDARPCGMFMINAQNHQRVILQVEEGRLLNRYHDVYSKIEETSDIKDNS